VVFQDPEIKRLNNALSLIAKSGVNVQVPLEYDPAIDGPYEHESDNELFVLKGDYVNSVKGEHLVRSLNIYIVGERQPIIDALYDNGFLAELAKQSTLKQHKYYHFRLHPNNKIIGAIAIPSQLL
jgi:hypothetical protein